MSCVRIARQARGFWIQFGLHFDCTRKNRKLRERAQYARLWLHRCTRCAVSVCDWCHTLTARWDFLMQFTVLSAPLTSFNLRVVHMLCSRGCLAASRIKGIGSSESVILYSAREISGARWEGRRMDEWWEYCSHSSPCSAGFVTSIS